MELEKNSRENLIREVQDFSRSWEKLLVEEGESKMAALYEQLQERLELIQTDLSSVQDSEEALQKFVSFTRSAQGMVPPLFLDRIEFFKGCQVVKSPNKSIKRPRKVISSLNFGD